MAAFLPEDAAGQDKGSFLARPSGDTVHKNRRRFANKGWNAARTASVGLSMDSKGRCWPGCWPLGSVDLQEHKDKGYILRYVEK